ncbi:SDR family oxidoreductase [Ornithobacterium rhinotracheale]|uniref:NAD-dependent epimerase/dehydratase family protein n=1 Tax=Ornithobacterium rhinotracheale TaxID=28251 RepID=UPI00129C2579|nr:SDR family oxidoreductase [Ornithobacterium rhinotracheale]MRJ08192.1 SDR family oxidoreductase [Ornithobacterium rhinotracheale]UOH77390.1 SDR family oxidoreductase [Ornithobacterium rhinotracheale]
MRIFISGGAGYLGYNLVRALEQNEKVEEIIVYDNLYRQNLNFFILGEKLNKTKFIKGDILNEFKLKKHLKNIDVVYHLAAFVESPYSYRDHFNYEQINHFGTATLVNALQENSPKKVIFTSSGAVYGKDIEADENTPPVPENAYGISKFNAEKYLELLRYQMDVCIFRIANVFGFNPMFRFDSVINNLIFNALLYNKIKINGNGENITPFVHIDAVTQRLAQAAFQDEPKIENLVEYNQSVNTVRDILLESFENLEFQYLNTQQKLSSYQITSIYHQNQDDNFKTRVLECLQDFKSNFKL